MLAEWKHALPSGPPKALTAPAWEGVNGVLSGWARLPNTGVNEQAKSLTCATKTQTLPPLPPWAEAV